MKKEKNLLTCPTAAHLLGLSPHAIREAVRRGDIAAVRPSPHGRPLTQLEELARWARQIELKKPSGNADVTTAEEQLRR
jgi:hypothetical protein